MPPMNVALEKCKLAIPAPNSWTKHYKATLLDSKRYRNESEWNMVTKHNQINKKLKTLAEATKPNCRTHLWRRPDATLVDRNLEDNEWNLEPDIANSHALYISDDQRRGSWWFLGSLLEGELKKKLRRASHFFPRVYRTENWTGPCPFPKKQYFIIGPQTKFNPNLYSS